mgnify:CR=1 FL=1
MQMSHSLPAAVMALRSQRCLAALILGTVLKETAERNWWRGQNSLSEWWATCLRYRACANVRPRTTNRSQPRTAAAPPCRVLSEDAFLWHALAGAHIRLADNGQVFETTADRYKNNKRFSSHDSEATTVYIEGPAEALVDTAKTPLLQEELQGRWVHVLLGKASKDGVATTWFQMERTPWRFHRENIRSLLFMFELHNMASHGVDFARYRWSGRQQGVHDNSENTEDQPMRCAQDCDNDEHFLGS